MIVFSLKIHQIINTHALIYKTKPYPQALLYIDLIDEWQPKEAVPQNSDNILSRYFHQLSY